MFWNNEEVHSKEGLIIENLVSQLVNNLCSYPPDIIFAAEEYVFPIGGQ